MRALIIVILLVLAALFAGWVRFSRDGDSATIQLDGAEVRSDTEQIMQEGRELVDQVKDDDADAAVEPANAQPE